MMYRKKLSVLAAASLLVCSAGCTAPFGMVKCQFSNVMIGGGGYLPGITYSKAEKGLRYVRTDMGGAYRKRESDEKWVPLLDHLGGVGADNWNLNGVESIAADPTDAKRVYLSCGTYANANGAVLVSDDYGETFTQVDMPFPMGSNLSGRGVGERMMVNPKDNKQIFLGTRTAGLWESDDYGKTWAKNEAFPTEGDYFQERNQIGVMWVEFAPETNDVYVGAAVENGCCIMRSKDAGKTWETLPANLPGMYPLQAEFSANGMLYLCYSDTCGPNANATRGAVQKYHPDTGTFTDITPDCGDGRYGGFSGITVDANNPDVIVCGTLGFWSDRGDNIYRSADGGSTWTPLFTQSEKHYVMDTADAEWLKFGSDEAKTGWWVADIEFDPFDSDVISWGTGATLYSTKNLTALGTDTPVTIAFDAHGIEETAVFKTVSVPQQDSKTPQLYSIMGDLTGFAHMDVHAAPDKAHHMNNGTASDLAAAWSAGNIAVYCNDNAQNPLTITEDGGATWHPAENPPEHTAGGTAALNADGSKLFWVPGKAAATVYFSDDLGKTWFIPNGIEFSATIYPDKKDANLIYAVCGGSIWLSEDGGVNFTDQKLRVADHCELIPVTDQPGALWIRSGQSVGYSKDYGRTVEYLKEVSAYAIGAGIPKEEGKPMVLYLMGDVRGQGGGVYMSENLGQTFSKLTDEKTQFGNVTFSITGDANRYGRFYFATNGRGIVMGDIN